MGSTSLTSTTHTGANPAITAAEVIEFREANLAFAGTVSTKYTDDGVGVSKRWMPITLPNSGAARSKAEGNDTSITFDVSTETDVTLTINQWYYSAFDLEEFENSLSIVDLQKEYTKAAAYVVNLAVDDALAALPDNFSQTVGTLTVPIADADVRRAVQYLEDANVPMGEDIFFAMSPAAKSGLLGIDRYTSSDFNRGGGGNIITGEFGDIYGLRCWQSTNVEGTNAAGHDNAIYHRDAMALAWRMKPDTKQFDDIDTLSHQVAISTIFGVVEVRDDHGVWLKGP